MSSLLMTSFLLATATTPSPTQGSAVAWDETRVDTSATFDVERPPGLSARTAAPSEPEPEPGWRYEGFYMVTGVAPGTTFDLDGINPMLRYDVELGMQWQRKKWAVSFGADAWLLQYYERQKVGGGLHGVVTVSRRPVYMRVGAGSLTGIPGTPDDNDVRPGVGGLLGFGLEGGGERLTGRFGFDYHVSLDKSGRVNNTVMLAIRLKF